MSIEAPKRIQRKRSKGWKMPENTVYVGRPTIWGNPFPTAEQFHEWLAFNLNPDAHRSQRTQIHWRIKELRGKNLACWCSLDCECHADVLLKLANREEDRQ